MSYNQYFNVISKTGRSELNSFDKKKITMDQEQIQKHNNLVKVSSLLTLDELKFVQSSKGYQVIALEDQDGNFKGCFPLESSVESTLRASHDQQGQLLNRKLATGG